MPTPTAARQNFRPIDRRSQQGVSLFVTMVLIFGVLLLAALSVGGNVVAEKASANATDADIAFQSAEAALRAGEAKANTLGGASDGSTDCTAASGVLGVCFLLHNNYRLASTTAWSGLTVAQAALCPAAYGCASATTPSILDASPSIAIASPISGVANQPRYIIEVLPSLVAGEETQNIIYMYRVTAKGWGRSASTTKILQSVYYPINN